MSGGRMQVQQGSYSFSQLAVASSRQNAVPQQNLAMPDSPMVSDVLQEIIKVQNMVYVLQVQHGSAGSKRSASDSGSSTGDASDLKTFIEGMFWRERQMVQKIVEGQIQNQSKHIRDVLLPLITEKVREVLRVESRRAAEGLKKARQVMAQSASEAVNELSCIREAENQSTHSLDDTETMTEMLEKQSTRMCEVLLPLITDKVREVLRDEAQRAAENSLKDSDCKQQEQAQMLQAGNADAFLMPEESEKPQVKRSPIFGEDIYDSADLQKQPVEIDVEDVSPSPPDLKKDLPESYLDLQSSDQTRKSAEADGTNEVIQRTNTKQTEGQLVAILSSEEKDAQLKGAMQQMKGALGWQANQIAKRELALAGPIVSNGPLQNACISLTNHWIFQVCVALLILSNTAIIAIEADQSMRNALKERKKGTDWADNLDFVYTPLFLAELLFRIAAERAHFIVSQDLFWNAFDVVVVLSAVIEMVFHTFNFTFMRVLRVFRMMRVLRVIRVFKVFRELRLMIGSILISMLTLTWALMLLLVLMFTFAVVFLQGLALYLVEDNVPAQVFTDIALHFPSLSHSLYTLLAVISGGLEWTLIANLFSKVSIIYTYVFIFYIVFVIFGVLNVLTGIFVESAGNISKIDNELVIQNEMDRSDSFMNQLEKLFTEIDTDHSGTITWAELCGILEDPRAKAYFAEMQMDVHEAEGLFKLLDTHADGQVSFNEFMVGCMRLKGGARSLDIASMMYDQKKAVLEQQEQFSKIIGLLQGIHQQVNRYDALLVRDPGQI